MYLACPTYQGQCHGLDMQQWKGKPWPPVLKELTGSTPDLSTHVLCVWNDPSPPPSPTAACPSRPPSFRLGFVRFLHLEAHPQNPWPEVTSSAIKLPPCCAFFFPYFYWHLRTFFSFSQYRFQKIRAYDLYIFGLPHSITHNDMNAIKYARDVCWINSGISESLLIFLNCVFGMCYLHFINPKSLINLVFFFCEYMPGTQ